MATAQRSSRKKLIGIVYGSKPDKTIVVHVTIKVKHPVYGKFVKKTTKVMAHDPSNECKKGDRVALMSTRPLSKHKNWRLVNILTRAK